MGSIFVDCQILKVSAFVGMYSVIVKQFPFH